MSDARAREVAMQLARALAPKWQEAALDVRVFAETVLTDEVARPIRLAPIHRTWYRHVSWCWQQGKHALILAPFAHGKTRLIPVGLTAFLLGREPTARVKVVCNDDSGARQRVTAVARIITQSINFRMIFPGCEPSADLPWTQHEIYLRRPPGAVSVDPSLQARGIFTIGVGGRADYVIFDDIVDQRNSLEQPEQRAKVGEFLHSTWMSRLEPEGRAAAIGTTWHREDAWSELMRNAQWVTLRQYVKDDLSGIGQEVYNAPDGYPDLLDRERLERDAKLAAAART